LCSEEELLHIEEAKGLSSSDLDARKEQINAGLEMTETLFKTQVEELQKQYHKLSEEKTIKIESLTQELGYLLYVDKSKDEL